MSSAPPRAKTFDELLREKKEKDPNWGERSGSCWVDCPSGLMDDSSALVPRKKEDEHSPAS